MTTFQRNMYIVGLFGVGITLFYLIFVEQPTTTRSVYIAIVSFFMGGMVTELWYYLRHKTA